MIFEAVYPSIKVLTQVLGDADRLPIGRTSLLLQEEDYVVQQNHLSSGVRHVSPLAEPIFGLLYMLNIL